MDLAFASDNAADTVGLFASSGQGGLHLLSTIPRPMLKVFSASASERFACSQAKRTTDGMGQVPKSTSAFTPAGKARFRFSVMPPPVI